MAKRSVWSRFASAAFGIRVALCLVLCAGFCLGFVGCTRKFFRQQADREVSAVLQEKDKYPAWKIEQYHVYPDPRARFADPTNPDRPPMPPDDPAAYDLSPNPQKPGKAGIGVAKGLGYLDLLAQWDEENRAALAAELASAPAALSPIAGDSGAPAMSDYSRIILSKDPKEGEPHAYILNLEQAAELGMINSREFQDRREDLYLTALPVTLERFAFSAQFFAAEQTLREWAGRETTGGNHNSWSFNSGTGFTKLFSTGALLLFQFANQTVVEMSRPVGVRATTSQSTLSLDLIQPLLRGGGRAVTLEPLTQAERNLFYQIRSYARFRKEFFVAIAGGGGGSISGGVFVPRNVIANPTFTPGSGFGSSGILPGQLPAVTTINEGLQERPGAAGRINLQAAIPAPVSGYLGTLLQFVQIDIDRANIANLQKFIRLFEGFKEGGDVSQLQVDQVEQQLLQGRSSLLTDEQQYLDSMDQFKLQLGLPTDTAVTIDERPMQPLIRQFRRFEQVLAEFDAVGKEAANFADPAQVGKFRSELTRLATTAPLVKGTSFPKKFPARWKVWSDLSADDLKKRLKDLTEERQKLLDKQIDLEKAGKPFPPADRQRLVELEYDIDLGSFEQSLRAYEGQPWKTENNPARQRQQQILSFRLVVNAFVLVMGEARAERIDQIRELWPKVPALLVDGKDLLEGDLDEAQALAGRTALANRLDLLNVRAQLVDAWRQIAVFANALLGTLNVEYHLTTQTPAGQAMPLDFSGSRTRHELALNTQLPLVRFSERNNYRASLIAYQRERRALMEAEDLALQSVRGEIRQLRVLAENYKIQQRQVELAYMTVENSLDVFQAPPAPPQPNAPPPDTAARAATLTQQLLNAQRSLPLAQNSLLTVWTNYVNARFQLYRDLELLPLDNRGVWIDEPPTSQPAANEPGRNADLDIQRTGVEFSLPGNQAGPLPGPGSPYHAFPPPKGQTLEPEN
jgi:outer membrane protein TolC